MLTTVDNPFNPFTDFVPWYMYDMEQGYNTCGYLARIAHTSDALSEEENEMEMERAINEILRFDFRRIYRRVYGNVDKMKL